MVRRMGLSFARRSAARRHMIHPGDRARQSQNQRNLELAPGLGPGLGPQPSRQKPTSKQKDSSPREIMSVEWSRSKSRSSPDPRQTVRARVRRGCRTRGRTGRGTPSWWPRWPSRVKLPAILDSQGTHRSLDPDSHSPAPAHLAQLDVPVLPPDVPAVHEEAGPNRTPHGEPPLHVRQHEPPASQRIALLRQRLADDAETVRWEGAVRDAAPCEETGVDGHVDGLRRCDIQRRCDPG